MSTTILELLVAAVAISTGWVFYSVFFKEFFKEPRK